MFNGSGVYTLPGAQLANGATISATENNQFRNDVATALNTCWTRDGQAPATANIPMGSHKLTGLAAGTGVGDSVRFEQLPSATNKLDLTTSVTGTLPVANGGSGAATLTGVLKGNGTSAFTAAVAGTDYLAPAAIGTTVQGYAAELQGATQGGINGMKNRIINGAMMIDQRNAGASLTVNTNGAYYPVDRFYAQGQSADGVYTVQQVSTAPTGFINSIKATVTTADSSLGATQYYNLNQTIEGLNVADLGWGAVGAATVTLSFWVNSSVTGTYSGAFNNSANDRSYPFTYVVNSANTWEQKTIVVPGDTTGTWLKTNGVGIKIFWSLGTGSTYSGTAGAWAAGLYIAATGATNLMATNGATFYITGVQLEKGSTATSFDYRPYGAELALCQRYYEQSQGSEACFQPTLQATNRYFTVRFLVQKRASPTMSATFTQGGSGSATISLYTGASNSGLANGTQADVSSWTASAEL